jgi:hypothetical protein
MAEKDARYIGYLGAFPVQAPETGLYRAPLLAPAPPLRAVAKPFQSLAQQHLRLAGGESDLRSPAVGRGCGYKRGVCALRKLQNYNRTPANRGNTVANVRRLHKFRMLMNSCF